MIVAGLAALWLGKDVGWDFRNYHFYNGYALISGRLGYDIAPAQIQTYLNPALDLPLYLGILHLPPRIFGFIMGALGGIGLYLLYLLAISSVRCSSPLYSRSMSMAIAGTAFFGAAWFSGLGATNADNLVSIFVLAALLATLSGKLPFDFPGAWKRLFCIGLLLGIGTGLKLTIAIYLLGYFAAYPLLAEKRTIFRQYVVLALSAFSGIMLSLGWWSLKLWNSYQSPLFPFYNKLFKSPFFDLYSFTDPTFLPKTLTHKLFFPFYFAANPLLVAEMPFRDLRLAALYIAILAVGIWLLISRRNVRDLYESDRTLFFLIAFCGVSYLLWQNVFAIYRYAVVLEMLTPLMVVLVVNRLFLFYIKQAQLIALSVLLILIITGKPIAWQRVSWEGSYVSLTTAEDLEALGKVTVLMTGMEPTAYIIPFFPKTTRFIRLRSNLNYFDKQWPHNDRLWIQTIRRTITEADELKIMLTQNPLELSQAAVFGIKIKSSSCKPLQTSLGDSFLLCDASYKGI